MEGQKSLEMGRSGSDNLLQEDEVFHELSPLDFRYPGSSGINYDLDAAYQMDNLSGVPIHASMDILPDPTVVYEGGILAGQDGELGFPNQELTAMNSLSFPDQGMPEMSFSSFLNQGMNSINVPDQEMAGMSFSSFPSQELNSLSYPGQGMSEMSFSVLLTQGINSLDFPSQELFGTSFLSFPIQELNSLSYPGQGMSKMSFSSLLTQELNSLSFPSQDMYGTSFLSFPTHELNPLSLLSHELSMMDILSFPTQGLNSLSLPSQELFMMDTLSFPTQETFMNTLEFTNQGFPMMDTFGLPTQKAFMNTLEFPNPGLPMMDTLGLPTQEPFMNTLELPNQGASMLESLSFTTQDMMPLAFPYQTQPMTMTMEHVTENEGTNIVISSGYEQLQQEFGHHGGNGNGDGGSESNLPLRLTLSREMISQYFHLSITAVAKALNVGKTLWKRRCRELGIKRWSQRKFKSLQTIISHLQESGESSGNGVRENVQETITRLDNERKQMEETPNLHLEYDTIRLRQACIRHRTKRENNRIVIIEEFIQYFSWMGFCV